MRHLNVVFNAARALAGFQIRADQCGHPTYLKGPMVGQGETRMAHLELNKQGRTNYCLSCLGSMAIRCAWCGEPIFIGDPITLLAPAKNFQVPTYAVPYPNSPTFVGCLGENCCDTAAEHSGFWVPGPSGKGEVERIPSALELALSTGKMVIGDTTGRRRIVG